MAQFMQRACVILDSLIQLGQKKANSFFIVPIYIFPYLNALISATYKNL